MEARLSDQQKIILMLLFKFRFSSTTLLSKILGTSKVNVYKMVLKLVNQELVIKVYEPSYRIDRKPAFYYLSKSGVTFVRKHMELPESAVHTLYKNSEVTTDFIAHCMKLTDCFLALRPQLPEGTDLFSRTEINRFRQFPKNRPDLYIRTPDQTKEAFVVIIDDSPQYIVRKRIEEIIKHSEDEGWDGEPYPTICFVLRDERAVKSFSYTTHKKLESMGMEEDELRILAAPLAALTDQTSYIWSKPYSPKRIHQLIDVI